jgi:hypothetical protein
VFFNLITNGLKQDLRIKAIGRIEPIVGRPVTLVAVLRAQQAADGVTAKTDQLREDMAPAAVKELCGAKCRLGAVD